MDSTDGAIDGAPHRHEPHKHTKRNVTKSSKHGKKPTEEAPLLVNEAPDDEESAEIPHDQLEGKSQRSIQKAWHWLLHHPMLVIIIFLLIGGIIALSVYFAGQFARSIIMSYELNPE